jgi:hypothetical protein
MADRQTTDVLLAPSEKELRLFNWLSSMANESAKIRNKDAQFDKFDGRLNIYDGQHWPSVMPSFKPPVVINELRTLILSEASDLTDANLRIYVTRDLRTAGRDETAERAIHAIWAREQIDMKLMNAIVWALICGTGFLRFQFDPSAGRGRGDIVVSSEDPRNILPDPDAIDDRGWQYVIHESVLDLAEVKRLFPLTSKELEPDDNFSIVASENNTLSHTRFNVHEYTGPLTESGSVLGGSTGYKKARVRLLDCVIYDDKTETDHDVVMSASGKPMLDDNGAIMTRSFQRKKYPTGRRIVGANGKILFDGPNPNDDFGIIRVTLEPTLSKFWGTGFVQQTGELQLAADKLQSGVVENAIRLNNGIVVATTNTGLDWESFAGIPAQIVQINPGSTFDIKYPNPMPPDMIQAPERLLNLQRRILGFPDSRQGTGGKGNVSAEMTETEISQSQGPTRLRARMLYFTVQRIAEVLLNMMARHYTTPRAIPAVEGESFKPVVWTPLPEDHEYSVYVDPASFQIMSNTMLKRLSLALYRLHAIDRHSLLETIGWPDWESVARRLNQAEAAAAQAKIAEKQAGK